MKRNLTKTRQSEFATFGYNELSGLSTAFKRITSSCSFITIYTIVFVIFRRLKHSQPTAARLRAVSVTPLGMILVAAAGFKILKNFTIPQQLPSSFHLNPPTAGKAFSSRPSRLIWARLPSSCPLAQAPKPLPVLFQVLLSVSRIQHQKSMASHRSSQLPLRPPFLLPSRLLSRRHPSSHLLYQLRCPSGASAYLPAPP